MQPNPADPETWDPEMKASYDRWVEAGKPNMLEFIAFDYERSRHEDDTTGR